MQLNFDVISCVVLPIGGYFCMKEMKRRAKKAIDSKTYTEGFYRFKPVYDEKAVLLAKGYARSGVYIFVFSIFLPFSMALIKYIHL